MLSVIVPSYNEEKNIVELIHRIRDVMKNISLPYEILFVNDGSRDNTLHVLRDQSQLYEEVRFISFSRNFGKEAAMLAGLKSSYGSVCIIMDGDLQHPPEMIPELLKWYDEGYDQVVVRRNRNGEQLFRKIPTRMYYKLINSAVDVKLTDGEGDFRLISSAVKNAILSLNEYNRFSKGIFEWVGFKKKSIPLDNVVRQSGQSTFRFMKLIDYGIDGILSYNNKPLRLCFYFGALTMIVCLLYIFITLIQIINHGIDEPGYFTIISSVLFLGGVQLFSLGIIGEYIGRIYYETKQRPHYIIQEESSEEYER